MMGYEVEETLSKITYNTLWFDLNAISGLSSIRYEKNEEGEDVFYINNSDSAWESMTVGGFSSKMFSRRFDIEFRTQYFYTYDAINDEYKQIAIQVPMFFVQEENLETFSKDVKSKNNVEISVNISDVNLNAIMDFYDELIPIFKENKETLTSDDIVNFIGDKIIIQS